MTDKRREFAALIIGVVGLASALAGWRLAPEAFAYGWLIALVAWLGWPLGCMGLLLVHALTGGKWGYAVRRQLIGGARTLLLLPLFAVPLALVAPQLYPWLRADAPAHLANAFYLNGPAFITRGLIYVFVWIGLGEIIARALRRKDAESALGRVAPVGLILLALTITFAAIDVVMSLDPLFASSIFGLITIAEMGLLALAASVLAAVVEQPPDGDALSELGQLLLALTILWGYLDFMQTLIVWQSDLPSEAPWYVLRWSGGWGVTAALIAGAHFILPFFILLTPIARRSRLVIAGTCALLILGAALRCWWLVAPASGANLSTLTALAAAATMGATGMAVALALRATQAIPQSSGASNHV